MHKLSKAPTSAGGLATAADIAWLMNESNLKPASANIPKALSDAGKEFAGVALNSDKLLWSCHYAIDRFAPAVWVLVRRRLLPAVVVCPPASLPAWKAAWDQSLHEGLPSPFEPTVREYDARHKGDRNDITLITYDRLRRRTAPELTDLANGMRGLVLDESHWAREETSQRYRALAHLTGLLRPGTPIIAITSQPIANRLRELCVQLRLIGVDDPQLSDPDRLRQLLAAHPDRVARKLAGLGLLIHHGHEAVADYMPTLVRQLVPVKINTGNRREVRRLQRQFEDFLTTGRFDPRPTLSSRRNLRLAPRTTALALRTGEQLSALLVKAPRLKILDKFEAALLLDEIRRETSMGKLKPAVEFIRAHAPAGPLIVMVEQRSLGEAIAQALKVPFVNGSMSQSQRRIVCGDFQSGATSLLVLSIALQNVPPLTRAQIVVVVDMPWNQAVVDRAMRSIYQPGARDSITAFVLTDDEQGLEGFIRQLHAYKVVVAQAVLRGIDPGDEQLLAILNGALMLEAAGLHPDDWFKPDLGQQLPRLGRVATPRLTTRLGALPEVGR